LFLEEHNTINSVDTLPTDNTSNTAVLDVSKVHKIANWSHSINYCRYVTIFTTNWQWTKP